ncbi:MAG: hypothetical protein JWP89_3167 [Schlesneria sp.]|nr:hypothetical protein [Schlesneria sp.]
MLGGVAQVAVAEVAEAFFFHAAGLRGAEVVGAGDRDLEVAGAGFDVTVEERDVGGIAMTEVDRRIVLAGGFDQPGFLEGQREVDLGRVAEDDGLRQLLNVGQAAEVGGGREAGIVRPVVVGAVAQVAAVEAVAAGHFAEAQGFDLAGSEVGALVGGVVGFHVRGELSLGEIQLLSGGEVVVDVAEPEPGLPHGGIGRGVRDELGIVNPVTREDAGVRFGVVVQSQHELLEVVLALGSPSGFSSLLHSGEQQRNEDGNDRDDDQQFDQRKRAAS